MYLLVHLRDIWAHQGEAKGFAQLEHGGNCGA